MKLRSFVLLVLVFAALGAVRAADEPTFLLFVARERSISIRLNQIESVSVDGPPANITVRTAGWRYIAGGFGGERGIKIAVQIRRILAGSGGGPTESPRPAREPGPEAETAEFPLPVIRGHVVVECGWVSANEPK